MLDRRIPDFLNMTDGEPARSLTHFDHGVRKRGVEASQSLKSDPGRVG